MSRDDSAGVAVPPPLVFVVAFAAGWLLNLAIPLPILPATLAHVLAPVFGLAALAIAAAAWRELRRAGTPVDPYKPSTALVTGGPFAYSRNPLYLSLILLSLALALVLNAAWCVAALVPGVAVLRRWVITCEEAYLLRRFGDAYRSYCAATRRWL
jgi:protein-S-isoprenylcysteine O-methyltransferase Ste14